MALQTKTFSLGDFAKANGSNGYILDLIITEESTDIAANTSQISYTLQLRSGSSNRFQDHIWASVTIAGAEVARLNEKQLYAYYNHTYNLLSGTMTVAHNADGTLDLAVQGNIWGVSDNKYAPPDMAVSGVVPLTHIPRVSQVSVSPGVVAAGGRLTIYTNRKSDNFKHILLFQLGDAGYAIAQDVGDSFEWDVPEDLAAQFPADTTGWGTITCQTYFGWLAEDTYIGSSSCGFAVTVNQNDITRPQLAVELSPVGVVPDAFAGLYIQGKTKVRAHVTATAWHSQITDYAMNCGGFVDAGIMESGTILESGNKYIKLTVTDARGFSRSWESTINVLPYGKPSISPDPDEGKVVCCRCDAYGNPNINGTHILVKAGRSWYGLEGKNLCRLQWRYRSENGGWNGWQTLLERTATENQVSTVLPVELETKTAYMVQLGVVDDMGEDATLDCPVGTANTPFHLGKGGRNVGLGRYCDYSHENAVDVGWPIYMGSNSLKELQDPQEDEDAVPKKYVDSAVGGATIRQVYLPGINTIRIQSEFGSFESNGHSRQAIFLFGIVNSHTVYGVIFINDAGGVNWTGTEHVSVAAGSSGQVIIVFSETAWDHFLLMSPEPFEIV